MSETPDRPGEGGDLRDQAVASIKRKQAFKQMMLAYVAVNALLILIWAAGSSSTLSATTRCRAR